MDTFIAIIIAFAIAAFFLRRYLSDLKKSDEVARHVTEKAKLYSDAPKGLHPRIDATYCIGCGTCTAVCPEGDVLAMLGGKAVIANGQKCIGHGLCAEACPVGAITMGRYAIPHAGVRVHDRRFVRHWRTRRIGADQECSESGARLYRYHHPEDRTQAGS